MTTIFERVETALGTISPAVPFALGVYETASGALPDQYMTHKLIVGFPEDHADNAETARSQLVQVTIWSKSFLSLPNVDAAMTAAGFQKGDERQLAKDPKTGHHGLAKDYIYQEFNL